MSIKDHLHQEEQEHIPHVLSVAIDLFSVAGYILKFNRDTGFSVICDTVQNNPWGIMFADKDEIILQYSVNPHSLVDVSYQILDDGEVLFDLQLSGISSYNQDMLDVVDNYSFSCTKPKLTIKEG